MSNNISFKDVFIKGAVIYNPVLIQLVGLCPVVAASTTLARAAMLSAVMCIELIITCVVASAFLKKVSRWVRVPLYLAIGMALICPILWYIETKTLINLSLGMKIYIPLIAVNSVTAVHCEQFAVKNDVKLAFYDAAAVGIGTSVIFIIIGAIRELLSSSDIGGISVNLPITFKGMALPFGCLILLGFMAAGLKAFVARFYPEYVQNREPSVKPQKNVPTPIQETTEVEIFDEFWSEPEEVPVDFPEEKTGSSSDGKSASSVSSSDSTTIKTNEEIEEFFKSLGIDIDDKGAEK